MLKKGLVAMDYLVAQLLHSWQTRESKVCSNAEVLEWIAEKNKNTFVDIKRTTLTKDGFWYYDEKVGCIQNRNKSFFNICGLQSSGGWEQPIIVQDEIGFLGIILKSIKGVLHCLMQAKIEPGNANKIQISPTIQATRSNFMQLHGGKQPMYLEYFLNAKPEQLIVDQIQSEQSSCFFKKRNRNIIIMVNEPIEVLPSHRWMTIGQIKHMMKVDNLVNMDTRTVLSCVPYCMFGLTQQEQESLIANTETKVLMRSVLQKPARNPLPEIYAQINQIKMFEQSRPTLVPLHTMTGWEMTDQAFQCKEIAPFRVIFCDIAIEGREVKQWSQPLFEATGISTFGLLSFIKNGKMYFVVKIKEEAGCFDVAELGPTVQQIGEKADTEDIVVQCYWDLVQNQPSSILHDVMLSEEGGRFYHEQNRNMVVLSPQPLLFALPKGYFALDYYTINQLIQINNCANIQLRNIISLLEV